MLTRPTRRTRTAADEKLIKGAQAGRRADLEELFRRELPPLRKWAFANVPSSVRRAGETDDFVQIALLRTLRRLPHLGEAVDGTLQPYLRRVLKNLVRDHTRSVGRRPIMQTLEDWDQQDTRSPLGALLAEEAYARYRKVMERLSPRARAAVTARLERGLDYAAVAKHAQCASAAAARVLVGRALARVVAGMRGGTIDADSSR